MGITGLSPKAVFLDRDGTLNRAFLTPDGVSHPPTRVEDLELLPGVPDALSRLQTTGFVLVVVTNQPDVARGTLPHSVAEAINAELIRRLPLLSALECCYHDNADACDCRKPKPGMLEKAAKRLGINLRQSYVVGDSWRDTGAGKRAGCTTIQLGSADSALAQESTPDYWAADITQAAELILSLADACSPR